MSGKIRLFPIVLEAFFVVLGVVLALAANEWREQRNNRHLGDTALESIRSELATNEAAIASSLSYHLGLQDSLYAYLRTPNRPLDTRFLFTRGYVAPASLLHTAWDAANATNALGYMAYADVLALGQIYEAQRAYDLQSQQSGRLIYEKLFNEGHEGMLANLGNLGNIIAAFWYRECGLLTQYAEVTARLDGTEEPDLTALPPLCLRLPPR